MDDEAHWLDGLDVSLPEPPLTTETMIRQAEEIALVELVMKLTGGSANPAVAKAQIANWREKYAHPQASG